MTGRRPEPALRPEPSPNDESTGSSAYRDASQPETIRVAAVVDGEIQVATGTDAIAALPRWLDRTNANIWVDLAAPARDQVEAVGTALRLHHLIIEDVLEGNQRAKIETTDGVVHIVLFHLAYDEAVIASEVDFVLGHGFLMTVHAVDWDPMTANHLRGGIGPVIEHGPDHVLWALADDIVDRFFPFADRLGDAIDAVQDDVIRRASPETLEQVFVLKRELIDVRRAVSPVREIFNQLTNRDTPLVDPDEIVYFRDIYDHVIRLTDELDNYRELTAATLDVYLSTVNNNLSTIMKRLTGVTVILAGIGAVGGIFGMSEAGSALAGQEPAGFWIITAVAIIGAGLAVAVLRRIGWI